LEVGLEERAGNAITTRVEVGLKAELKGAISGASWKLAGKAELENAVADENRRLVSMAESKDKPPTQVGGRFGDRVGEYNIR